MYLSCWLKNVLLSVCSLIGKDSELQFVLSFVHRGSCLLNLIHCSPHLMPWSLASGSWPPTGVHSASSTVSQSAFDPEMRTKCSSLTDVFANQAFVFAVLSLHQFIHCKAVDYHSNCRLVTVTRQPVVLPTVSHSTLTHSRSQCENTLRAAVLSVASPFNSHLPHLFSASSHRRLMKQDSRSAAGWYPSMSERGGSYTSSITSHKCQAASSVG